MAADHKEATLAAILLPSVTYCPWNFFHGNQSLDSHSEAYPCHMQTIPSQWMQSLSVITCALLRGHWTDPLLYPLLKLIRTFADVGPVAFRPLRQAYAQNAAPPTSLVTALASYIKKLGGTLEGTTCTTIAGQTLRLLGPENMAIKTTRNGYTTVVMLSVKFL